MLERNPSQRITANEALRSKYFNTPSVKKSKINRKQNSIKMKNDESSNNLFARKRSPFVELSIQQGEIKNGSVLCAMIDENE